MWWLRDWIDGISAELRVEVFDRHIYWVLEKLTGSQLVKKFPELYGTRKYIIPFKVPATCPCHELE
jgi:hypothetical protein